MLALLLVLTSIAYELYVPADKYLCCRDFYIECFIAKLAPILSSMNQVCYLLLSHSFLTILLGIINLQLFLLYTRLLIGIH